MVNMVIDYFCKNSCCCIEDMDEVYDISINDLDVISCCLEQEIFEVIQEFMFFYCVVFNLYVIEGYVYKEIVELFDIIESIFRLNLVKVWLKLKEILSE